MWTQQLFPHSLSTALIYSDVPLIRPHSEPSKSGLNSELVAVKKKLFGTEELVLIAELYI